MLACAEALGDWEQSFLYIADICICVVYIVYGICRGSSILMSLLAGGSRWQRRCWPSQRRTAKAPRVDRTWPGDPFHNPTVATAWLLLVECPAIICQTFQGHSTAVKTTWRLHTTLAWPEAYQEAGLDTAPMGEAARRCRCTRRGWSTTASRTVWRITVKLSSSDQRAEHSPHLPPVISP